MFIYESHMGGLFIENNELSLEETYCETCGDYDGLLGEADTRREGWKILKPVTDINNSGGWDYDYVQEFLDEHFGLAELDNSDDYYDDICFFI